MKILHVYKDFEPPVHGGMERHIALMCKYQREWADVEALTCSRSLVTRVMDREGTKVTEVGEWFRLQSAPASPTFPLHMRRLAADIVVVHVPNPTAELGWLLTRPRGKLIVRYHSDVVRQAAAMRVYGPLQMHFLQQADMILPTSDPYVRTSPMLQRVAEKCRVVPLGIEADAFAAPDAEGVAALHARYGGPFVFFCGKHRYYKGLEYLVRAAKNIDAPIVIAGDGPETERCKAVAAESGGTIHWPGPLAQGDLVDHFHACGIFVYPSIARSEAFGIAILEAHACGKPVVATRLGTGTEYANLHGETGLNVSPEDADALAAAINELMGNVATREAMGERARARVVNEFRAETVARREFDLFEEALS